MAELRTLVDKVGRMGSAIEDWRFKSYRLATLGDRVFLLLQRRAGPALIGYGYVTGASSKVGQSRIPICFDRLLDPAVAVLATTEELRAITNAREVSGAQASAVPLSENTAQSLEQLVVRRDPIAMNFKKVPSVIEAAPNVQLRDADFARLVRYTIRRPWGEIPPTDQEAYSDLRLQAFQ